MRDLLFNKLNEVAKIRGGRLTVGLLGLGKTNGAVLNLLLGMDEPPKITVRQKALCPVGLPDTVTLINTLEASSDLYEDVLIPSPSVRREKLSIPDHTVVFTDYDLLFDYKPKNLFLVSGSDGKSTTVTLASLLLYPTFPDIFTGGNIGIPLWTADRNKSAFLLELSSFTLRYTKPRGGRAILTNVTPNHLDWHASLSEYEEAKLGMIFSADEPILNLSDPVSERAARDIASFCLISADMMRDEILSKYKTEHTVTVADGYIRLDGEALISAKDIKRRERHNLLNLASAIAISIGYTDKARIAEVAKSFQGLEERCESFSLDGITYISSSIDTTPDRTRTTLSVLGKRVRIILGGRGKGLSLDPLKNVLISYAERIAVYGEIRCELISFIESDKYLSRIPHDAFADFDSAVDYASEGAADGDTVLLSPAATGYGEFRDYKERGEHFKKYVKKKHTYIE